MLIFAATMSNESLDTLRTTLLIFSVIILVAALYKRMLIVLGKNKNKPKYALVDDHQFDQGQKKLSIKLELPKRETVKIDLFSGNSSHSQVLLEKELSPGLHHLEFNLTGVSGGSYHFTLTTHNHSVSQYFEVA
ncbi:MAG: hypothetical protein SH856_01275 [Flavobacteriales bacterium]|nr:hypothetical protein [Flavobacteriales bacterium]